ncbi:MAG: phosphatidate cytidylyltransferase [Clostridia bacterium]|nr:phosphatidate cytidylyltransferase [Clostridia bacterium]
MLTRVLTGFVALCVLIPILIFSATPALPIGLAIVAVICLYEIFKCIGMEKKAAIVIPPYLFALVSPFLLRYMENRVHFALIAFMAAALYLLYLFPLVIWSHGKLAFSDVLTAYALTVYILAALLSILYVRDFIESGKYIYLLIFIGAWVTDVFAYFTGFLFGKHKLIEDVSPKKTIEGSIGGIVFCALGFALLGIIVDHWFEQNANILPLPIARCWRSWVFPSTSPASAPR